MQNFLTLCKYFVRVPGLILPVSNLTILTRRKAERQNVFKESKCHLKLLLPSITAVSHVPVCAFVENFHYCNDKNNTIGE